MKPSKTYLTDLTYQVNGAAIEVHKALGAGLLESTYHKCMKHELVLRGISFMTEMLVPVNYKGLAIDANLRCDLFIENILTVELKSVDKLMPIHEAQIITYMKLLGSPKGIIYNFNTVNLYSEGQKTYVNDLFRLLPE
ncbi:GxxExxY protein [Pedobacter alluvionis]|uniref:GxxExxY protein n=1 Tax=Pedobacter alluvionis TaxID=475253 RepID=A0A497Y945_9SPHI|nr:GxxExxY protein [Pedobacter alluvionis]RLJ79735.1 GxxExxY protein [Pedobacter alluvionis]TFB31055.1 GxxExxY protein [Pedobacter alluvionis]